MMSQVKNLRAMFEQRGDTSPPERGREGAAGQSESPRPLSRVRANFVTVEKDGRIGLQRDTSSDSIPTLSRTMSAGTEGDLPTPTTSQAIATELISKPEDARPLFAQAPKQAPSAIPGETTSVSPAKVAAPHVATSKLALGATIKNSELAPPFAPAPADVKRSESTLVITSKEKTANQEQKDNSGTKPTGSDATPAEKSPVRKLFAKPLAKPIETGKATADAPKKSPDALTSGAARHRMANSASKDKSDAPKAASTNATTNAMPMRSKISTTASVPKETTSKTAPKATTTAKNLPKAISTAKTTTKTSTKSTGVKVKTPTSPSKPSASRLAGSKPAADKKTTTSTGAEKKSTPAASAPKGAVGKKPANSLGAVKPKSKSPTRPAQLPSSLTTHAASSTTKTHQSLAHQSGNSLAVHGASQALATRSVSRASVSTSGALRKQKSTIGLQRPSIGPPPKQAARDHPIIKKEKPIDESFLERMMRPTQSFASKTADKVHQSPPRSVKSRDSYGSTWSTASSTKPTKPTKEKVKSVSADRTAAAPVNPVIVEPVQEVDSATLHTEEHDPKLAEAEEEAKADAARSESAEPTSCSVAESEEPVETAESESEEATVPKEAEQTEEPVDEAHAKDGVAEDETAEETTGKAVAEEAVSNDEAAPVTEATVEETTEDASPRATPEVSIGNADVAEIAAEPMKDITHIDVAEIDASDTVVAKKSASAEAPASPIEL